jgi:hypothetical protein
MMQANHVFTVKGNGRVRIFGLPQREHDSAIAQKNRRVVRHLANLFESQGSFEKMVGFIEPGYRQANVVHPAGDRI